LLEVDADDRLGAILITFGPLVIGAIILIIWGVAWIPSTFPPDGSRTYPMPAWRELADKLDEVMVHAFDESGVSQQKMANGTLQGCRHLLWHPELASGARDI